MSSIISPVSDLVGAVDTIVGRLQERAQLEDAKLRERDDLRDALLDFLHLLRRWEACAQRTNALAGRVLPDGTLARPADWERAVMSQSGAADETLSRFGTPTPEEQEGTSHARAAKGSISDVLFVYVPEAEEQLTRAMNERRDALNDLERALEQSPGASTVKQAVARLLGRPNEQLQLPPAQADLEELDRTYSALHAAVNRLAWFMRKTFGDAGQTRVRAPE